MENAVTALRIAGGILIAMLVLALIVFGIRRTAHYEQEKEASLAVEQIAEFNKPLLSYENDIVSGFRMISLANLANDNNKRFSSSIDGYKSIKIYARLINATQLPGWTPQEGSDDYKKVKLSTGTDTKVNYFNMINYVGKEGKEGPYYKTSPNRQTEFKQLYFQCVDVSFDKITGRVEQMVFDEIRKRN